MVKRGVPMRRESAIQEAINALLAEPEKVSLKPYPPFKAPLGEADRWGIGLMAQYFDSEMELPKLSGLCRQHNITGFEFITMTKDLAVNLALGDELLAAKILAHSDLLKRSVFDRALSKLPLTIYSWSSVDLASYCSAKGCPLTASEILCSQISGQALLDEGMTILPAEDVVSNAERPRAVEHVLMPLIARGRAQVANVEATKRPSSARLSKTTPTSNLSKSLQQLHDDGYSHKLINRPKSAPISRRYDKPPSIVEEVENDDDGDEILISNKVIRPTESSLLEPLSKVQQPTVHSSPETSPFKNLDISPSDRILQHPPTAPVFASISPNEVISTNDYSPSDALMQVVNTRSDTLKALTKLTDSLLKETELPRAASRNRLHRDGEAVGDRERDLNSLNRSSGGYKPYLQPPSVKPDTKQRGAQSVVVSDEKTIVAGIQEEVSGQPESMPPSGPITIRNTDKPSSVASEILQSRRTNNNSSCSNVAKQSRMLTGPVASENLMVASPAREAERQQQQQPLDITASMKELDLQGVGTDEEVGELLGSALALYRCPSHICVPWLAKEGTDERALLVRVSMLWMQLGKLALSMNEDLHQVTDEPKVSAIIDAIKLCTKNICLQDRNKNNPSRKSDAPMQSSSSISALTNRTIKGKLGESTRNTTASIGNSPQHVKEGQENEAGANQDLNETWDPCSPESFFTASYIVCFLRGLLLRLRGTKSRGSLVHAYKQLLSGNLAILDVSKTALLNHLKDSMRLTFVAENSVKFRIICDRFVSSSRNQTLPPLSSAIMRTGVMRAFIAANTLSDPFSLSLLLPPAESQLTLIALLSLVSSGLAALVSSGRRVSNTRPDDYGGTSGGNVSRKDHPSSSINQSSAPLQESSQTYNDPNTTSTSKSPHPASTSFQDRHLLYETCEEALLAIIQSNEKLIPSFSHMLRKDSKKASLTASSSALSSGPSITASNAAAITHTIIGHALPSALEVHFVAELLELVAQPALQRLQDALLHTTSRVVDSSHPSSYRTPYSGPGSRRSMHSPSCILLPDNCIQVHKEMLATVRFLGVKDHLKETCMYAAQHIQIYVAPCPACGAKSGPKTTAADDIKDVQCFEPMHNVTLQSLLSSLSSLLATVTSFRMHGLKVAARNCASSCPCSSVSVPASSSSTFPERTAQSSSKEVASTYTFAGAEFLDEANESDYDDYDESADVQSSVGLYAKVNQKAAYNLLQREYLGPFNGDSSDDARFRSAIAGEEETGYSAAIKDKFIDRTGIAFPPLGFESLLIDQLKVDYFLLAYFHRDEVSTRISSGSGDKTIKGGTANSRGEDDRPDLPGKALLSAKEPHNMRTDKGPRKEEKVFEVDLGLVSTIASGKQLTQFSHHKNSTDFHDGGPRHSADENRIVRYDDSSNTSGRRPALDEDEVREARAMLRGRPYAARERIRAKESALRNGSANMSQAARAYANVMSGSSGSGGVWRDERDFDALHESHVLNDLRRDVAYHPLKPPPRGVGRDGDRNRGGASRMVSSSRDEHGSEERKVQNDLENIIRELYSRADACSRHEEVLATLFDDAGTTSAVGVEVGRKRGVSDRVDTGMRAERRHNSTRVERGDRSILTYPPGMLTEKANKAKKDILELDKRSHAFAQMIARVEMIKAELMSEALTDESGVLMSLLREYRRADKKLKQSIERALDMASKIIDMCQNL